MANLNEFFGKSYALHGKIEEEQAKLKKNNMLPAQIQKQNSWNRQLNLELGSERINNQEYCICENCRILPYSSLPRENYCCRESFQGSNKWCRNLSAMIGEHSCITNHADFKKLVLDKDVLRSHLLFAALKKGQSLESHEIHNVNLRFAAASTYVLMIHRGTTGGGIRLELPNCVRNAIINSFPEASGKYTTFEAIAGEEDTICDYDMRGTCHVCGTFNDIVHRMPETHDRAMEWAKNLGWVEKFKELCSQRQPNSILVCTRHFPQELYESGKLKRGALPSKYGVQKTIDSEEPMPKLQKVPPIPQHDSGGSDMTYQPSQCSHSSFKLSEEPQAKKKRVDEERKNIEDIGAKYCLLSNECFIGLLESFPGCFRCRDFLAKRTFSVEGTTLVMKTDCVECGIWRWSSTSRLHEDSLGSIYEGNMDFCTSVFTSGIPYERILDASKSMGMSIVSKSQFYSNIKSYTKPAIDVIYEEISEEVKHVIKEKNREGDEAVVPLSILGDAQYDSAGFSASICRYIAVDNLTKLIIDWQIFSREDSGGNSPILEKMAFESIMNRLECDESIGITDVTTDKHPSVGKLMKFEFPHIRHYLDKWHVVKNLKKQFDKDMKLKRNTALSIHWEHILCHIWVSIEAADGNPDLATELVKSTYWHLQGIHTMPQEFKILRQCPHGPLPNNAAYLDKSKHPSQLQLLFDILNNEGILNNIRRCAPTQTTSVCESFNAMATQIYLPKNIYFDTIGTSSRMKLAVCHHNSHRMEIWNKEREGIDPETRKKFSKAQKRMTEIQVHPPPSLDFKRRVVQLAKEVYKKKKDERLLIRHVGRPQKATDLRLADQDLPADDDESSDISSEDPVRHVSINQLESDDENPDDNPTPAVHFPTRRTRSSKSQQKHAVFIRRQELYQKIQDYGADADNVEFYDIVTGKLLLPF